MASSLKCKGLLLTSNSRCWQNLWDISSLDSLFNKTTSSSTSGSQHCYWLSDWDWVWSSEAGSRDWWVLALRPTMLSWYSFTLMSALNCTNVLWTHATSIKYKRFLTQLFINFIHFSITWRRMTKAASFLEKLFNVFIIVDIQEDQWWF